MTRARSAKIRGTWRGRAQNEADRLDAQLTRCGSDAQVRPAVAQQLDLARAAATAGGPVARFWDWLTGVSFDRAWSALHTADELLTDCMPWQDLRSSRSDLIAELEARLKPEDSRLKAYRQALETCAPADLEDLSRVQRADIRAAKHTANTASLVAQGVVRRWRNLLLAVGAAIFAVDLILAILDLAVPDFLPLEDSSGGANQVWEVEIMGAFGGAIAAVFTITRFSGYTDPNGLPLYQALLRIPVAAAVALLGVLLLQSGVIDALKRQPADAILAYSVLFGYAQEPLMRMVDRKAGEVLGPARGKDDPLGHPTATGET